MPYCFKVQSRSVNMCTAAIRISAPGSGRRPTNGCLGLCGLQSTQWPRLARGEHTKLGSIVRLPGVWEVPLFEYTPMYWLLNWERTHEITRTSLDHIFSNLDTASDAIGRPMNPTHQPSKYPQKVSQQISNNPTSLQDVFMS